MEHHDDGTEHAPATCADLSRHSPMVDAMSEQLRSAHDLALTLSELEERWQEGECVAAAVHDSTLEGLAA